MISKNYYGYGIDHETVENLRKKDWLLANATDILKNKINLIARLPIPLNRQITNIVIKSFGWRNPISKFFSPIKKSRAEKAYSASMELLEMGISVPKPISVYTFRNKGKVQDNFLITEDIVNHKMARDILRSNKYSFETKKVIVKKIAEIVTKLHNVGRIHSDLTRGNFLVQNFEDINNMKITLIDLNRIKKPFFLTPKNRMWDIAKLNLCSCNYSEHQDCLWDIFFDNYKVGNYEINKRVLKLMLAKNKFRKKIKKVRKNIS